MKKSVVKLTVVLVALVTVSIASVNAQSQPAFLYNIMYEGDKAVSKDIYKFDKSSGLHNPHLSYAYTYTSDGLPESRKTLRWDDNARKWKEEAVIVYNYNDLLSSITLEYAEWNEAKGTFDAPKEKAVYHVTGNKQILSYTAYEKEKPEMNWTIKEHFDKDNQFTAQQ
ncbi:MAG: DUF3836 domain-containing protein [Tannerella sp.]|jgi:hypothetical protein|nr:DUF3836 domain-containing protein [Tannerella sp.]